jgi:hypothetical protein
VIATMTSKVWCCCAQSVLCMRGMLLRVVVDVAAVGRVL